MNGVPLVLAVLLSLLVMMICLPPVSRLIVFPLELLAGLIIVFILGMVCDVDGLSLWLRVVVLLLASLAFPLSQVAPAGISGAVLMVGLVAGCCMSVSLIERLFGRGCELLLVILSIFLLSLLRLQDWGCVVLAAVQCGALLVLLAVKWHCWRARRERIYLGECGSLTMTFLLCAEYVRIFLAA